MRKLIALITCLLSFAAFAGDYERVLDVNVQASTKFKTAVIGGVCDSNVDQIALLVGTSRYLLCQSNTWKTATGLAEVCPSG